MDRLDRFFFRAVAVSVAAANKTGSVLVSFDPSFHCFFSLAPSFFELIFEKLHIAPTCPGAGLWCTGINLGVKWSFGPLTACSWSSS
jgi:hypothetical protein|tara:strand:- start:830 stop:1090 length:261 start_codon:yes stop_codon:yes gene_type:complete